jgi:hypothetical protein
VVLFRYFLTDFKDDKGKTSQVIKSIVDMFAIAVSMQSHPFDGWAVNLLIFKDFLIS